MNLTDSENDLIWSIIVPVKASNADVLILRKLSEAVANEPANIQLIFVIDDKFGIPEVVSKFCSNETYPKNIFHFGSYGNPGDGRNAGLEIAKGRWISFSDADDYLNVREMLSLILDINKSEFSLGIAGFNVINEHLEKNIKCSLDKNRKLSEQAGEFAYMPGIWRMVFRRDSIHDIRFPSLNMGEDQLFILKYLSTNPKILIEDNIVYTYRTGVEGQLTGSNSKIESLRKIVSETASVVRKLNNDFQPVGVACYVFQNISLVKYGNWRDRFRAISAIRKEVSLMNVGIFVSVIRKLLEVKK